LAMFDIIAEPLDELAHTPDIIATIIQEAGDIEELFINWLNELLSLASAKGMIFTEIDIEEIGEQNIRAKASALNNKYFRINTEIKAATYHELKVQKSDVGWLAEVILDV
jgi:SHS2 domain-containing protein